MSESVGKMDVIAQGAYKVNQWNLLFFLSKTFGQLSEPLDFLIWKDW